MLVNGQALQSIWYEPEHDLVRIIDQTCLPHTLSLVELTSLEDACKAILGMQVRGAPLIGVTAAYGVYLGLRAAPEQLAATLASLRATRPTAVNLQWALARCEQALAPLSPARRPEKALALARQMEMEDIAICEAIGNHGAKLLAEIWQKKKAGQSRLNVLTHCNAGALAAVDWGTALAVVYKAAAMDIPVHVWVDETRPRNQGAALTCWELGQQGIPHTLVVDNAGGHLMQTGAVDVCVVGSDRTTLRGDVCNKIGTYLKALAAQDLGIPFYVALPLSSIDFSLEQGGAIPIEERQAEEVSHVSGLADDGTIRRVRVTGPAVTVSNPGFDVTPARLVTALITEQGICQASRDALQALRASLAAR